MTYIIIKFPADVNRENSKFRMHVVILAIKVRFVCSKFTFTKEAARTTSIGVVHVDHDYN